MVTASFTVILILLSVVVFIVVIAFLAGKKAGDRWESIEKEEAEKTHIKNLSFEKSKTNELKREIDTLRQKNQEYLGFLVRIPDAVRNLNSNLSYDETLSAIIRLTKDMVDTETIELYVFDKETNLLELEVAYGSKKEQKMFIKYGEGVIGKAAENKVTVSRGASRYSVPHSDKDKGIDIASPILFKGKLIGVIGLGKVNATTGNERRFISMIADFAGVALENCEYLQSAKKEAVTDSLTGLYNKKYFGERAIEAAQKASNYNFPLSIFMFDIDHFKNYNDTNGHVEGDSLLKELAQLVREASRGTDLIARYGGEEFIVLLPNTDKEGCLIYAEKIRKRVEEYPFRHKEKQPSGYVSISGGVATFPSDGDTTDAVVRHADEALYKSKKAGRNMVSRYEQLVFSTG